MTKHTPIKRNGTHLFIQQNPGGKKFALAEVFRDVGAKQAEEYAAFIVRACNCHDEFVAACQDIVDVFNEWKPEDDPTTVLEWFSEAVSKARAALAKAKGEA